MSGFLHRIAARVVVGENRSPSFTHAYDTAPPLQESTFVSESPSIPLTLDDKHAVINNSWETISTSFQEERNLSYQRQEIELASSIPEVVVQTHMKPEAVSPTQRVPLVTKSNKQNSIAEETKSVNPHTSEVMQSQVTLDSSDTSHITHSVFLVPGNDNDLPAALLPKTTRVHSPAGSPGAAMPYRTKLTAHASPAKAEESMEVHVHIGRIEVTAVHEAPVQKPRPVSSRKPMSLDEYLDRRGKS